MVLMGASALVLMAATPYVAPTYSTYYDRSAWDNFNSIHVAGEVFGSDGTASLWNFFGLGWREDGRPTWKKKDSFSKSASITGVSICIFDPLLFLSCTNMHLKVILFLFMQS